MGNLKFIAGQASSIYQYKNKRPELLKRCALLDLFLGGPVDNLLGRNMSPLHIYIIVYTNKILCY